MPSELPPPFDRGPAALVVAHPGHELRVHGWLELARKLEAARAYPELAGEVESALARFGQAAFRVERLQPLDSALPLDARVPQPPAYESHGERRVAAGIYSRVLRFREHFLPFAAGLRRLAGEPAAGVHA